MAEIKFNQAYENLTDTQKREFDGVMGMGGFNERYQADPMAARVTSDPDYATFAPISKAYGESKTINDGFDWGSLVGMSSADASEMPQKYGLQTNTMGGMTLNPDGSLNYNNQSPNLGYTPMADAVKANANFMDQFNTESGTNLSVEDAFPGMSTGDIIDSRNNRQAVGDIDVANIRDLISKSNMQRMMNAPRTQMNEMNTYGNTISEAMIDEDRIPGRVQESVPNYQNWFERMMSGAQDKLGGAWGKTKELGSRFKEGAGPVFGLASMFANATNPLNPKSFNYNPGLKGQLDFMDKEMGGWSTTNPNSGLMQYGADTPLAGQNVFSGFGSNDPIAQLEKTLARRQKTYDNLENQWGNLSDEDLETKKQNYFNKFLNPTTNWLDKIKTNQTIRTDKKNKALAIKEAEREARREDARNTAKIEAYTGQKMSDYRASRPRSERGFTGHGKSGMGRDPSDKMARGGRVRFSDGGLATLFTRRG